jgi:hypothetical protein
MGTIGLQLCGNGLILGMVGLNVQIIGSKPLHCWRAADPTNPKSRLVGHLH